MGFAVFGRRMAPRASAVTLEQSDALSSGEHPLCATEVEHLAVAREHLRNHARVSGKAPQLAH